MAMSGISSVPPRGTVMRATSWPSMASVHVDDASACSAAISCTVLGKPQIVQPASQVKAWSTGRCTMNVPSSLGSVLPVGWTKSVMPTSR